MAHSMRLGYKVQRLMALAEHLTGQSAAVTECCDHLLDKRVSSPDFITGASCLNNDSAPLQLCLTSSPDEVSLRIIGDPGAFHHLVEERYDSAVKTLLHFIERSESVALEDAAIQTVQALVPQSATGREPYQQGFVWIAVNPVQPGLAFYLEMAPLGHDKGWMAVQQWLSAVLPADTAAQQLLAQLMPLCTVASAGLEGSKPENTRAKIYFRLRKAVDLEQLGIPLFSSAAMKRFFSIAKGIYEVDLQGMVMSIGFQLSTGELADAKIDLCGHCIRHNPQEWSAILRQLTNHFDLAPMDTDAVLHSGEYEVAFVGLGLTTRNKPRLNLYVKHRSQTRSPEADEIWGALKDAVQYLQSIQQADGSWVDYQLPVGPSDQWVTAYAAQALARHGNRTGNAAATEAATKAATWLAGQRTYPAGWGYNGITGPDSDSTAMAIALFDELGWPVAEKDRLFLQEHWREGEGIATYDGPDAWGSGHWDVTPWGYLGMLPESRQLLYDAFQTILASSRMHNGFWRAYWWRNPYYSTFITLEVMEQLGMPEPDRSAIIPPASIQIDNPFDLVCCIGIECIRNPSDPRIGSYLRALLDWQRRDGRWEGAANLRVTDNDCHTPWENPSGSYYKDEHAVLTTATVIRILSKIIPSSTTAGQMAYHWI